MDIVKALAPYLHPRTLFGIVLVLLVAFTIWRGEQAKTTAFKRADKAACVRIESLKSLARSQIERALVTLPTLSYYKEHPEELAVAVRQIHRQLREFAPVTC